MVLVMVEGAVLQIAVGAVSVAAVEAVVLQFDADTSPQEPGCTEGRSPASHADFASPLYKAVSRPHTGSLVYRARHTLLSGMSVALPAHIV